MLGVIYTALAGDQAEEDAGRTAKAAGKPSNTETKLSHSLNQAWRRIILFSLENETWIWKSMLWSQEDKL